MKYNLVLKACDKGVEYLWQKFEDKECPAQASPALINALRSSMASDAAIAPGGIFDEILKLVCQAMENGQTEPEAEQLICSHMKYNLVLKACDKGVEYLWQKFEGKECPALTSSVAGDAAIAPGGIFDEILKLVCRLMENGQTEPEAE